MRNFTDEKTFKMHSVKCELPMKSKYSDFKLQSLAFNGHLPHHLGSIVSDGIVWFWLIEILQVRAHVNIQKYRRQNF